MNLFRAAMGTERHPFGGSPASEGGGVRDFGDGDGDGDEGAVDRMKGGVDCELLVAGSYLHAHRVVLATRSPVLRDMIAQVQFLWVCLCRVAVRALRCALSMLARIGEFASRGSPPLFVPSVKCLDELFGSGAFFLR